MRYTSVTDALPDTARMQHFYALDPQQRIEAICRLAATGMSDRGIAAATGISVEQILRVLSEHQREPQ